MSERTIEEYMRPFSHSFSAESWEWTIHKVLLVMDRRLTAIESAAREPATTEADGPLCVCGHVAGSHTRERGHCWHMESGQPCSCTVFVPAPPPAEPVDKVLFHIAEAARLTRDERALAGLEIVFLELQGRSFEEDAAEELLTYGLKP